MIESYVVADLVEMAKHRTNNPPDDNSLYWVAHGCNCRCIMGAGIAKQFREEIPKVYEADLRYERTVSTITDKLGKFSTFTNPGTDFFNLYTQEAPNSRADVQAIYRCFALLEHLYGQLNGLNQNITLHIPKIASGLGGLSWNIVSAIIDEACPTLPITVYVLDESEVE